VTAINGPARLWRNITPRPGHWLGVRLRGTRSNRDGIGARLQVTAGGRTLHNHATTSVGYASSSEPVVRFGLGDETAADRVEIRWPSGRVQALENVAGDRVIEVTEPNSVR